MLSFTACGVLSVITKIQSPSNNFLVYLFLVMIKLYKLLARTKNNVLSNQVCQKRRQFVRREGSPLLQGEWPGLNREFEKQLTVDLRQEKTNFGGMWVASSLNQK